jgi:hypothetical protein
MFPGTLKKLTEAMTFRFLSSLLILGFDILPYRNLLAGAYIGKLYPPLS